MSREILRKFLEKSELPLSRISKATGICRTSLSYYLHGHRKLNSEQLEKTKNYIESYKKRWLVDD